MRFLTFVIVLIGAQLVSMTEATSLEEIFGLSARELEQQFGMKLDQIERKMYGLEAPAILRELEKRGDMTPDEVFSLLERATDLDAWLHSAHKIRELIDISRKEPELCNEMRLRQIVVLHQGDISIHVGSTAKDNISRYCRQKFNELFEFCMKNAKGQAFSSNLRKLYPENTVKEGMQVHEPTKMEEFVLDFVTTSTIKSKLMKGNVSIASIRDMLKLAYDDSDKLLNDNFIGDYKSTLEKDPALCTIGQLKRMIAMHNGKTSSDGVHSSTFVLNLTRFIRFQFNELVEYCLKESEDESFKKPVAGLYRISRGNASTRVDGLTSMEEIIMRMPAK